MVFPVVMYGCESWTIKKAEHQRTDGFELWCWRTLLRVFWTARRSNQSILKDISPEYFLEGLMVNLILQYFCHLMRRADPLKRPWCWERLKAGEEGDDREWDGCLASSSLWTGVWVSSGGWCWQGSLSCCSTWLQMCPSWTLMLDYPSWLTSGAFGPAWGKNIEVFKLFPWG